MTETLPMAGVHLRMHNALSAFHKERLSRQPEHPVPGLRTQLDLEPDRLRPVRDEHPSPDRRVIKFSGIGCSSKIADLLPESLLRLQQPARTHALHRNGRVIRRPKHQGHRRLRRRRHCQHRHGSVQTCDAPQCQHGLHRREQRRVRPDQGPVLGHRRGGADAQEAGRQPLHACGHLHGGP
jgi:hypothetical protein